MIPEDVQRGALTAADAYNATNLQSNLQRDEFAVKFPCDIPLSLDSASSIASIRERTGAIDGEPCAARYLLLLVCERGRRPLMHLTAPYARFREMTTTTTTRHGHSDAVVSIVSRLNETRPHRYKRAPGAKARGNVRVSHVAMETKRD